MKPKYSSYEEINRDLQILKVEKELSFYKLFQSFDQLKEDFTPYKLVTNTFGTITSAIKSSEGVQAFIVSRILKLLVNKVFKK